MILDSIKTSYDSLFERVIHMHYENEIQFFLSLLVKRNLFGNMTYHHVFIWFSRKHFSLATILDAVAFHTLVEFRFGGYKSLSKTQIVFIVFVFMILHCIVFLKV